MTRDQFLNIFEPLCLLVGKEVTKKAIVAWYDVMKRYKAPHFANAVSAFLKEEEYKGLPMPSKLTNRMDKMEAGVMDSEEAWQMAKRICNGNDFDRAPFAGIDCPVMLKACQAIGKEAFDKSDTLSFARRDFIANYEAASKPGAVKRIDSLSVFDALGVGSGVKEVE